MAVVDEVRKLNLPTDQYLIVGGSALEMYGIRKAGDIDLMVAPDLFVKLKNKGWKVVEKHPGWEVIYHENFEIATDFCYGNYQPTPKSLLEKAVFIKGLPVIELHELTEYKKALGREKDIKDIELITLYLKRDRLL